MDYKELLRKYMALVVNHEGVDFVFGSPTPHYSFGSGPAEEDRLTQEEWDELLTFAGKWAYKPEDES